MRGSGRGKGNGAKGAAGPAGRVKAGAVVAGAGVKAGSVGGAKTLEAGGNSGGSAPRSGFMAVVRPGKPRRSGLTNSSSAGAIGPTSGLTGRGSDAGSEAGASGESGATGAGTGANSGAGEEGAGISAACGARAISAKAGPGAAGGSGAAGATGGHKGGAALGARGAAGGAGCDGQSGNWSVCEGSIRFGAAGGGWGMLACAGRSAVVRSAVGTTEEGAGEQPLSRSTSPAEARAVRARQCVRVMRLLTCVSFAAPGADRWGRWRRCGVDRGQAVRPPTQMGDY